MSPDLIAGRYRVSRAVGRGGMGTVWLCRDDMLGREVAVKQVGHLPGESATDRARAMREARSSAALNHKNVVSVFDVVDTEDGNIWLVMEYVPSRTLSQILREDGPLDPRRAARIGAQIADGLAAAHARGTIHRDVKPGNILVGDGDLAKISDFGIARMADDDQLTRTGLVTGTPSYFSPELARGEEPGSASDVYALGASLYAAVQGAAPYPEQRNAIAMLQQIATEPPPEPASAGPLATAINRMMDRDPRSRWSMADAAQALHRVAEPDPEGTAVLAGATTLREDPSPAGPSTGTAPAAAAPSTTSTSTAPPPSREDDRRRRSGLPWLAALALVLLLALGAGYLLMDRDDPAERPQAGDAPTAETSPTPRSTDDGQESPASDSDEPTQEDTTPGGDGAAAEESVQEYFGLLPEGTDAGWERLAPRMQQEQGRENYDAWWDSVESVELQEATSDDGGETVEILLTYRFTDGSAAEERQRLTLERSEGRYLIADDEVLSSRTVS